MEEPPPFDEGDSDCESGRGPVGGEGANRHRETSLGDVSYSLPPTPKSPSDELKPASGFEAQDDVAAPIVEQILPSQDVTANNSKDAGESPSSGVVATENDSESRDIVQDDDDDDDDFGDFAAVEPEKPVEVVDDSFSMLRKPATDVAEPSAAQNVSFGDFSAFGGDGQTGDGREPVAVSDWGAFGGSNDVQPKVVTDAADGEAGDEEWAAFSASPAAQKVTNADAVDNGSCLDLMKAVERVWGDSETIDESEIAVESVTHSEINLEAHKDCLKMIADDLQDSTAVRWHNFRMAKALLGALKLPAEVTRPRPKRTATAAVLMPTTSSRPTAPGGIDASTHNNGDNSTSSLAELGVARGVESSSEVFGVAGGDRDNQSSLSGFSIASKSTVPSDSQTSNVNFNNINNNNSNNNPSGATFTLDVDDLVGTIPSSAKTNHVSTSNADMFDPVLTGVQSAPVLLDSTNNSRLVATLPTTPMATLKVNSAASKGVTPLTPDTKTTPRVKTLLSRLPDLSFAHSAYVVHPPPQRNPPPPAYFAGKVAKY